MVVLSQDSGDSRRRGGWFDAFPLLLISVIIYNVAAWGGRLISGVDTVRDGLDRSFAVTMPSSDAIWLISVGDILVWVSLILLFIEVVRSTNTGHSSLLNHGMSIIVFIICLAEFLLFAPFATSVFFAIMLMTLLDVVAGFIISVVTARRDFAVG